MVSDILAATPDAGAVSTNTNPSRSALFDDPVESDAPVLEVPIEEKPAADEDVRVTQDFFASPTKKPLFRKR